MGDPVRFEHEGPVVTVTIDRPDAANALDAATLRGLGEAITRLRQQPEARVAIFTGAGDKAFCAGADLKERAGMAVEEVRRTIETIRDTFQAIATLPVPTIAAINGAAFGGGLELALACDIRIAAAGASMGLTETTLAIIPGGGGTQRLPRLVGPGRAKELILTGRRLSAADAAHYGLIEEVADPTDFGRRVHALAHAIAANGPIAVRAAKEAIDRGVEMPLGEALALETALYARTLNTADRLEGLLAFREKRAPVYRGE